MQTTSAEYDEDTGVLHLKLDDGAKFLVDNAWHAKALKDKISVGGRITDVQRQWLDHYLVKTVSSRDKLKARLAQLRRELRDL